MGKLHSEFDRKGHQSKHFVLQSLCQLEIGFCQWIIHLVHA